MNAPEVTLQPMSIHDIPIIEELEKRCFSAPWSGEVYRHELTSNRLGSYWVMRRASGSGEGTPPILAYGGYWLMGQEAHIVTIATHPDFRRQGLGRRLLQAMIDKAIDAGALEITLEVRASNYAAQALYRSMGFVVVGVRKHYYHDNGEDAILMTLFAPTQEMLNR
ncbi:ribosomal protein S18-alanine N-acetyltransferase [Caldilinea sp.]|jgi:ribosomal-protein-alanine N-acetyltransferase|uniref:ribosomal protein S18-alanine N-acetyltransferase n=1 Tax=Caldilinea sp. TaxID=2293560 RepID=UPI0026153515|nr:ribosomal protein S18-alanine N-acetyltransferase [uncultured Caldilinea sp.]